MPQNRSKLIDLLIGNISNAIAHKILSSATDNEDIKNHYIKELEDSLGNARNYREKINPINTALPAKDIDYIKNKIIRTVRSKLQSRILEGYKNINLNLIEIVVENILKDMKII